MDDPRLAGLTKSGRPSAATASSMASADHCAPCDEPPRRHGEAVVVQHGLGDALVHAHGRGEDARAHVGHAERLEVPLDHAVLAEGPVQDGEHDRARRQAVVEMRRARVPGLVVEQVVGRVQRVDLRRRRRGPRSASTHRLSCVSPTTLTTMPAVERSLDDPARRDARDLVLGRRPSVDDRQRSRIRHRPRLYNRRSEGNACDSPPLNSQPSSAGSWSGPMSRRGRQHRLPDDARPGSSSCPSWPSATGTTSSPPPSQAGAARLSHVARAGRRDGHHRRGHRRGPDAAWARWRAAASAAASSASPAPSGKTTTKDLVAPLPGVGLPDGGQRALLQQRARPSADAAQRARRRAVGRARDGRPRRRAHRPSGRGGPSRRRDRDQRRHGPRRVLR